MNTKMDIGKDPNPNRIQNEKEWGDSIFPDLPAGAKKEIKKLTPKQAKHFDEEVILKVMATYKGESTHENCMYILNNMETPDIEDLENKYFQYGKTLISYRKSGGLTFERFGKELKKMREDKEAFLDFPENKVYKPDFIKKLDATKLFEKKLKESKQDFSYSFLIPVGTPFVSYIEKSLPGGKYDIKKDKNFLEKSFRGITFLYGMKIRLDEIGNFFIGNNGDKVGLNSFAQETGGNIIEIIKNKGFVPDDEVRDRRFYRAGTVFSQVEPKIKTQNEKERVFKGLIRQAYDKRITVDNIGKNYIEYYNRSKTEKEFQEKMNKNWNEETIKFFDPKIYEKYFR